MWVAKITTQNGNVMTAEYETAYECTAWFNHIDNTAWGKCSLEYFDESTDYDYRMKKCIESRIAEYRKRSITPEEFMNRYFDGGSEAVAAMNIERQAVKAMFPKPVQA